MVIYGRDEEEEMFYCFCDGLRGLSLVWLGRDFC